MAMGKLPSWVSGDRFLFIPHPPRRVRSTRGKMLTSSRSAQGLWSSQPLPHQVSRSTPCAFLVYSVAHQVFQGQHPRGRARLLRSQLLSPHLLARHLENLEPHLPWTVITFPEILQCPRCGNVVSVRRQHWSAKPLICTHMADSWLLFSILPCKGAEN